MPATIELPYKFRARDYQFSLLKAIDTGEFKRGVAVWHRRAGKDISLLNLVCVRAMAEVGSYFYFFPTYNQGRKVLWEGMTNEGRPLLDYVPKEIASRNNQEMKLEFVNGSVMRVIGTDQYDSIRGTNPIGCVFSEYSYQDPNAWATVRPILDANNGWAVFNYTPNGDNHGKTLYDLAMTRPNWYCEMLPANKTNVFTSEQLSGIKSELVAERGQIEGQSIFDREYMCSFDAPVLGSYFGELMQRAEQDGRIADVPHDPGKKVTTYWDLGVGDKTSIWFVEYGLENIKIIDYYENDSLGLPHYVGIIQNKGYIYDRHIAPHDIRVREFGTGISRIETAKSLGLHFDLAPNLSIDDGLDAVRRVLPQCWFDRTKCELGISALKQYHKKYDDDKKVYSNKPEHDWSSNGADAFRMFAVTRKKQGGGRLPSDDIPADAGFGFGTYNTQSSRQRHAPDETPDYARF